MSTGGSNPSRRARPLAGRICYLLAIACLGFVTVIVVVAYVKGDVPDYLQHRWKFHTTFVPYFFSALVAAYASVVFSVLAACFNPRPSRFILVALCLGAVIAHGQWERHLRHKAGSPAMTLRSFPTRATYSTFSPGSTHLLGEKLLLRHQRLLSYCISFCGRTELPSHHKGVERVRMISVPYGLTDLKLAE